MVKCKKLLSKGSFFEQYLAQLRAFVPAELMSSLVVQRLAVSPSVNKANTVTTGQEAKIMLGEFSCNMVCNKIRPKRPSQQML